MRLNARTVLSMYVMFFFLLTVVSAASLDFAVVNDLPSSVNPGQTYSGLSVRFNNTDTVYDSVRVALRGADFSGLPVGNTTIGDASQTFSGISLDVPSDAFGVFSRTLFADVYNATDNSFVETRQVVFDASVNEQSFCQFLGMTESGDLEIVSFEITNRGDGDDEEWDILDEIEIEVIVENTNNDEDVDDVILEIRILDEDGDDVTNDFDLDDEEIDLGDIRDNDEETGTFVITELPVDLNEGDYRIYVVAYSDRDDTQCVSFGDDLEDYGNSEFYAEVEINKEHDAGIIVSNENINYEVTCGQTVTATIDLYNIGDDEEESVYVSLFSSELGLDQHVVLDNFRSGKRQEASFTFDLPNTLDKSFYNVALTTYWDWDDDEREDDVTSYDENSEDDLDENYRLRLTVVGDCTGTGGPNGPSNAPLISAELLSDRVIAGEEVVIVATITNPHSTPATYGVSVGGYQSWAELVSLQPSAVSVAARGSEDVTVRFVPTESGVHTFRIQLVSNGAEFTQDVSLNVEAGASGGSGFGFDFGDDAVMYGVSIALIVLIIILIVIILVVAARRS